LAIIVIYSVIVLVKKSKRHTIHSHNRKTSKK
jgi:hypothetical protein